MKETKLQCALRQGFIVGLMLFMHTSFLQHPHNIIGTKMTACISPYLIWLYTFHGIFSKLKNTSCPFAFCKWPICNKVLSGSTIKFNVFKDK